MNFSPFAHDRLMRTLLTTCAVVLAAVMLLGQTPSTGTQYAGIITRGLDTANAAVGDPVTLRDVVSQDGTITGATLSGQVSHVVSAGSGRPAELGITFTTLTLRDGTQYAVDGTVTGMQAKTKSNVGRELIGAVAGMAAGNIVAKAIFGATNGMGGFLGATAGYLVASNMKQNMTVPEGSAVRVTLRSIRRQATPQP